MANIRVDLVRYCKTDKGWKRLPVVKGKNGKLRPGWAILDGTETHLPQGTYQLRMYKGSKVIYQTVGDDATEATAALQKQTNLLRARSVAAVAGVVIPDTVIERIALVNKIEPYISDLRSENKLRTCETARQAINDFMDITGHSYADELTETSIRAYYDGLRKRGNNDRTIHNKHISLFGWFKWMKLDTKAIWPGKPPKYTKPGAATYRRSEISALYGGCTDEYHRIVIDLFLKTGMRLQEAMYLRWDNGVDFERKRISVVRSDSYRIKDSEERDIPMLDDLYVALRAWRKKNPRTRYVIGQPLNDKPNTKLLVLLKRIARRAGLNCGQCKGCRGKENECSQFKIKKFRSTYTTMMSGKIDPRTLMQWTGHADLDTLMLYLAPQEMDAARADANSVKWSDGPSAKQPS